MTNPSEDWREAAQEYSSGDLDENLHSFLMELNNRLADARDLNLDDCDRTITPEDFRRFEEIAHVLMKRLENERDCG